MIRQAFSKGSRQATQRRSAKASRPPDPRSESCLGAALSSLLWPSHQGRAPTETSGAVATARLERLLDVEGVRRDAASSFSRTGDLCCSTPGLERAILGLIVSQMGYCPVASSSSLPSSNSVVDGAHSSSDFTSAVAEVANAMSAAELSAALGHAVSMCSVASAPLPWLAFALLWRAALDSPLFGHPGDSSEFDSAHAVLSSFIKATSTCRPDQRVSTDASPTAKLVDAQSSHFTLSPEALLVKTARAYGAAVAPLQFGGLHQCLKGSPNVSWIIGHGACPTYWLRLVGAAWDLVVDPERLAATAALRISKRVSLQPNDHGGDQPSGVTVASRPFIYLMEGGALPGKALTSNEPMATAGGAAGITFDDLHATIAEVWAVVEAVVPDAITALLRDDRRTLKTVKSLWHVCLKAALHCDTGHGSPSAFDRVAFVTEQFTARSDAKDTAAKDLSVAFSDPNTVAMVLRLSAEAAACDPTSIDHVTQRTVRFLTACAPHIVTGLGDRAVVFAFHGYAAGLLRTIAAVTQSEDQVMKRTSSAEFVLRWATEATAKVTVAGAVSSPLASPALRALLQDVGVIPAPAFTWSCSRCSESNTPESKGVCYQCSRNEVGDAPSMGDPNYTAAKAAADEAATSSDPVEVSTAASTASAVDGPDDWAVAAAPVAAAEVDGPLLPSTFDGVDPALLRAVAHGALAHIQRFMAPGHSQQLSRESLTTASSTEVLTESVHVNSTEGDHVLGDDRMSDDTTAVQQYIAEDALLEHMSGLFAACAHDVFPAWDTADGTDTPSADGTLSAAPQGRGDGDGDRVLVRPAPTSSLPPPPTASGVLHPRSTQRAESEANSAPLPADDGAVHCVRCGGAHYGGARGDCPMRLWEIVGAYSPNHDQHGQTVAGM